MSPRSLRTLLQFRNSQKVAYLEGPLTWTYGMNPLERNALRWFLGLRQLERQWDF